MPSIYDWISTAVVIQRNGPEQGFPADISYDVEVNTPGPGGNLLRVDGVQPITRRRDQRRCEIEALPVGAIMYVASTGDVLQFTAWEFEALEDCEDAQPRPQMMRDPITGQMVPIVPTVGGVPTVTTGATAGGSTPGGGADGSGAGGGGEF